MNKKKLISDIYRAVIKNGINSSRADVMGDDPLEDKIYTRRININKHYKFKNNVDSIDVVCVSVNSDDESMKDTDEARMRFNMQNYNNSWVNIYPHEAPAELIEFIHANVVGKTK